MGRHVDARQVVGKSDLALDEPVWARFVRFTGVVAGTGDPSAEVVAELPDEVRIVERPPGDDTSRRSASGATTDAPRCTSGSTHTSLSRSTTDAGNDAASATAIGIGELHTDSAWVEADEDWFRVTGACRVSTRSR